MASPDLPSVRFEDEEFLAQHIQSVLDFYEDRVVDPSGGFFQAFRDDGTIYDAPLRHLVGSTRFVFNYATAYRLHGNPRHLELTRHGLAFLNSAHRQGDGHYAWELRGGSVTDGRAMTYGHAFVILAAASAFRAGVGQAKPVLEEVWDFLERLFWEEGASAYADERDTTLETLAPYRGQNANMHMCEALIAAFEATGEARYLDRASRLARRFTVELAAFNDGLIWEHYTADWQVDMEYHRDKPGDLFKPWGFQPGHQVEWAKLLLQLNAIEPEGWKVDRAKDLYRQGMENGWDRKFGGLVYGFAPDGSFCDADKYFWVQCEAFATAWRLYRLTGEARYLGDYQRLWRWSWEHLIDHKFGAWFRVRHRDGSSIDDLKSPPGKTDYHVLGACWDVLSQR